MRRLIPPALVVILLGLWLLLNETLQPSQILMGLILAVLFALAVARMRPLQAWSAPTRVLTGKRFPVLRRLPVAVGLLGRVLVDVLRSAIGVARVILGLHGKHEVHSGFLDVPLDLRDPHGVAVLAMILTATPGTVWVELNGDSSVLKLHVLDFDDEASTINTIKQRYERPLREIFE